MKKILSIVLVAVSLFGANLELESGYIKAHTEMALDSNIDIKSSTIDSNLQMDGQDLLTLQGDLRFEMKMFVSDNLDRDEHMYEVIEVTKFPYAHYKIESVTQDANEKYTLHGTLEFHGVEHKMSIPANIQIQDGIINLTVDTFFDVTEFGVEMPCMMFMCVRNKVDIHSELKFEL